MPTKIVYTTGSTVRIDYDETMRLFLTQEEHLPFSAGKLLQMLSRRTSEAHVHVTGVGLRICVGETCCLLTQRATAVLAVMYQRSRELQVEFPSLLNLFASLQVEGIRP